MYIQILHKSIKMFINKDLKKYFYVVIVLGNVAFIINIWFNIHNKCQIWPLSMLKNMLVKIYIYK